jgi:polysaccharide biosynthesis/export protein
VIPRSSLARLALLLLVILQGPVAWAANDPPPVAAVPEAAAAPSPLVALGAGDSVTLHVFGQPDMDGQLSVADDGTVRVPLAGSVPVKGLSVAQAARRIEKAFKDGGYFVDPHVSLTVLQSLSQRVSVLGEVRTPGRYPVDTRTTIVDLLAQAGGTTELASDTVLILHTDASGIVKRSPVNLKGVMDPGSPGPRQQQLLQAGDSVYVPRAEQFYILGEVQKPGMYKLESDLTVLQAVSIGGGATPRGSVRRIEIKRTGPDGTTTETKARPDDRVQPGDVIRVKESIF